MISQVLSSKLNTGIGTTVFHEPKCALSMNCYDCYSFHTNGAQDKKTQWFLRSIGLLYEAH